MITATMLMTVGLVMFAEDAPEDGLETEMKKLEGDWIPVCIKQGRQIRTTDFSMTVRIREAKLRVGPGAEDRAQPARVFTLKADVTIRAGGEDRAVGRLTINPLRDVKTFDLAIEQDFAGFGGNTIQGIYEWEGEVLKLGLNKQIFGDRPTRFDWVAILARDSKEEREAAAELARVLPFEKADGKAKCRDIVKAHPKTAAAMIAQEYLDYGLVSEQECRK